MDSWIYVFSKFTSEALLFEALGICILIASYAAFFVLKKRKFGAVDAYVPSGVVKTYLSELLGQAHFVRKQLFGLLSDAGVSVTPATSASLSPEAIQAAATNIAADPQLAEKMKQLEEKLALQTMSVSKLEEEKKKIEAELDAAKSGGAPAAGAGDGGAEVGKLKDKIKELEARLAEYSVIEDDLANLKRLQQENSELKKAMGTGGAAAAGATAAAAPPTDPAAEAAAPTPEPEPASEPAAAEPAAAAPPAEEAAPPAEAANTTAADLANAIAEPTAEATPTETPAEEPAADVQEAAAPDPEPAMPDPAAAEGEAPADPSFENLVDSVEESLADSAPAEPEPAVEAPAEAPAQEPAAEAEAAPAKEEEKKTDSGGGSDEDLLSEFEKMLNM